MHEQGEKVVESAVEARAGFLAASLALAVLAMALSYAGFFA